MQKLVLVFVKLLKTGQIEFEYFCDAMNFGFPRALSRRLVSGGAGAAKQFLCKRSHLRVWRLLRVVGTGANPHSHKRSQSPCNIMILIGLYANKMRGSVLVRAIFRASLL